MNSVLKHRGGLIIIILQCGVPVHQVLLPEKLTQASYKLKQVFNAGGLFVVVYCKCGFDIRVVLCTGVPSLIVRSQER